MNKLSFAVIGTLLAAGCSSSDPGGSTMPEPQQDLNVQGRGNDDGAPPADAHVHWQKDAHGGGGSTGGNLIDHGGKVLPSSNTYAVWWGPPSAFPSDAQSGIDSMFQGFNGTSF